jgi:hypothetical protein
MSAWDDFLDAFFRRRDRDGPHPEVLDRLTPIEREQAFHLLLTAAAERPGEVFAMAGLGHLQDRRAVDTLWQIMHAQRGSPRIWAAFALWQIDEDPVALVTLCDVLTRRRRVGGAYERVEAAAFLRQIDEPLARRALAVAIHDPDPTVRQQAYEGLVPVLGRSREIWNYVCKPDIHHHVRDRVDAALRRAGLA